jgi:hypothetical protein
MLGNGNQVLDLRRSVSVGDIVTPGIEQGVVLAMRLISPSLLLAGKGKVLAGPFLATYEVAARNRRPHRLDWLGR